MNFSLYAGIGASVGIGEVVGFFHGRGHHKHDHDDDHDDEISLGAKGLFGLNFTHSKQFEIFLEVGPLISMTTGIYTDMEGSIGFRFYP